MLDGREKWENKLNNAVGYFLSFLYKPCYLTFGEGSLAVYYSRPFRRCNNGGH